MMQHSTTRFGDIQFTTEDVVEFSGGLVGFPEMERYVLVQHKDDSPFRWLQSLDCGELAFLVVDPAVFCTDYAPEMPGSAAVELALDEETPRLVYTIVTIPRGKPSEMTLNLAGPLVLNLATGKAKQVVLEDPRYPTRCLIERQDAKGGEAA